MTTPKTGRPTGLPPGVDTAPLGLRLAAYLIDHALPAVVAIIAGVAGGGQPGRVGLVLTLVVSLAWGVFVWRQYALRAAGPGMRLMKLQLVGYRDGRPVGWGRFLLRWLVLTLLTATGVGLVVMIIAMTVQPRRQGWHDLAAESVVIKQRQLAPPPRTAAGGSAAEPVSAPDVAVVQESAPAARGGGQVSAVTEEPTTDPAGRTATEAVAPTAVIPAASTGPAAAPAGPEWVLSFDDDWDLVVAGLVLLGRNPQPPPGEEDAQLIKIADTTRTVSKTHLAVGVDSRGLWVMDRGSTNGSVATTPDGTSQRCAAGDVVPVDDGVIVSFGDHWFRVTRG